jgi:hypothetical protein
MTPLSRVIDRRLSIGDWNKRRIGSPVSNLRWPTGADQPRPRLLSFTRALRPPPDVLETRGERVLAVVAIAFVVWVLADIVLNGL